MTPAAAWPEFVAIDLETTGIDRSVDRIIEIGAVRFGRDGELDRFQTFVRPGIPIPPAIELLTTIREEDVAGAPSPTRAAAELAVFIGGRPVVGHNVAFDVGFLGEAGLPLDGVALDTYELASVLLPTAAQLNLGAVTEALGVELDRAPPGPTGRRGDGGHLRAPARPPRGVAGAGVARPRRARGARSLVP